MAQDSEKNVSRVLQLKFTLPTSDPTQFAALIKATAPFYELFGGKQVRLLQNVDNPAQFIQIIDYEIHESLETSRQQIAGDPRLQAFLQAWRQMFPGSVEVDVFREVEPADVGRKPFTGKQRHGFVERQADHVAVGADELDDECARQTLGRVAAG